jgi:hypothetical protein
MGAWRSTGKTRKRSVRVRVNAMETQRGSLDEPNDEGVMGDLMGDVDASQPDLPQPLLYP